MPISSKLRLSSVLITIALMLGLAACGDDTADEGAGPATTSASGGAGGAGSSGGAEVETDDVPIKDFKFVPETAKVKVGATVTWTNDDGFAHSVIADDKSFKSENFDKGKTFSHKFDTAGTFSYICGIHNYMTGTIVVA